MKIALNGLTQKRISILLLLTHPSGKGKIIDFLMITSPKYWNWLELSKVYRITVKGGAVYFMQREKNTENGYRNFERRCFYLVRTHAGKDDKVKVSVVDGSFF